MTTPRYRKRGAHAAPRRIPHPTRAQVLASEIRDEARREARALAELRARERGEATPSASRVETWFCRTPTCAAAPDPWTRPSLSTDGASCHRCGAPRPIPA